MPARAGNTLPPMDQPTRAQCVPLSRPTHCQLANLPTYLGGHSKAYCSVPTWLPSVVLIEVDEEAEEREVVLVAHSRPVPVGHIPLGEAHDQQEVIVAG